MSNDERLVELLTELRSTVRGETIADGYLDHTESTHYYMKYVKLCDEIRRLFNAR